MAHFKKKTLRVKCCDSRWRQNTVKCEFCVLESSILLIHSLLIFWLRKNNLEKETRHLFEKKFNRQI